MPNWVFNSVNIEGKADDVKAVLKLMVNDAQNVDFNLLIPMPESVNVSEDGKSDMVYILETYFGGDLDKVSQKSLTDAYEKEGITKRCGGLISCIPKIDKFINRIAMIRRAIRSDSDPVALRPEDFYISSDGEIYPTAVTYEECLILGKLFHDNREKYGASEWYGWSCSHWGTKWNASDTNVDIDPIDAKGDESVVANITFNTAWSYPLEYLEALMSAINEAHLSVDIVGTWCDEDYYSGNCGTWEFCPEGIAVNVIDVCSEEWKRLVMDTFGDDCFEDDDEYETETAEESAVNEEPSDDNSEEKETT